jgi:hypothetical protein
MGLDQFARTIDAHGNRTEIAYWRKHPNLQGWMETLWDSKGRPNANENGEDFNCVPLELTKEDLNNLEEAILSEELPLTTGFFFGQNSDNEYREKDLEFIENAREAIDNGLKVEYDSWW